MFLDHVRILIEFYTRPVGAVVRSLDRGRLVWGAAFVLLTALLLQAPSWQAERRVTEDIVAAIETPSGLAPEAARAIQMADLERRLAQASRPPAFEWLPTPASALRDAALMAVFATPLAILMTCLLLGAGDWGTYLSRNYSVVLVCMAMAWTAARLPFVPLEFFRMNQWPDPIWGPWAMSASTAIFALFGAFVLRSALGAAWTQAAAGSLLGVASLSAGSYLLRALGGIPYLFLSPWVLYFLWTRFGGSLGSIGDSLRARQNYRRTLEAATLNPHDADAQHQLGLIELQRRNLPKAEQHLREAARIDPHDADYLYQLGRVLRDRGDLAEAEALFERAVRIDSKTASSEVLRDLGGVKVALDKSAEALPLLADYVARREYDPAGLVYYGQALKKEGRPAEAKQAFELAVAAWKTLPKWRAGEMRAWERLARLGLKS